MSHPVVMTFNPLVSAIFFVLIHSTEAKVADVRNQIKSNVPPKRISSEVVLKTVRDGLAIDGCAPDLRVNVSSKCQSACRSIRYPTMDGTCNNIGHPIRGAAFTPLIRTMAAGHNYTEDDLPGARKLSQLLYKLPTTYSGKFNAMVMQWGQFLTHDILKMTVKDNATCSSCVHDPDTCLQLPVDPSDPNSMKFSCMMGKDCCIREAPAAKVCRSGREREFLNENTAVFDASNVYGCSQKDLERRFIDGSGPQLKTMQFNHEHFMPGELMNCSNANSMAHCHAKFDAGDERVNVFVGLGVFHNIFLREHNRIVKEFKLNARCMDAKQRFFETRKILSALMQKISYKDWLPKVIGGGVNPYQGYNPEVEPQVSTEVSTAALRVGHAMLDGVYPLISSEGVEEDRLSFEGSLKNSKILLTKSDQFLRGMLLRPSRNPVGVKQEIANDLFHSRDLAAINIQRGRELGVAKYRSWRRYCGLSDRIIDFPSLAQYFVPEADLLHLEFLYRNDTERIDLYVGLLMEKPLPGAMVGETTACLLRKQFEVLRDGDRFWYQKDGVFTGAQVEALERTSFSSIICNNMNHIHRVPADSFLLEDFQKFIPCSDFTPLDLGAWSC